MNKRDKENLRRKEEGIRQNSNTSALSIAQAVYADYREKMRFERRGGNDAKL